MRGGRHRLPTFALSITTSVPKTCCDHISLSPLSLQLTSELLLRKAQLSDEGTYFCSAQNPAGVASAKVTLRVLVRPSTTSGKAVHQTEEGQGHHKDRGGEVKEKDFSLGEEKLSIQSDRSELDQADHHQDDNMIKVRNLTCFCHWIWWCLLCPRILLFGPKGKPFWLLHNCPRWS